MSDVPAPSSPESPNPAPAGPASLSDADRALLDVEAHVFRSVGAKEKRIREVLGMTSVRYHVRLNQLLDDPAALAYAPALVHRLRARRPR